MKKAGKNALMIFLPLMRDLWINKLASSHLLKNGAVSTLTQGATGPPETSPHR